MAGLEFQNFPLYNSIIVYIDMLNSRNLRLTLLPEIEFKITTEAIGIIGSMYQPHLLGVKDSNNSMNIRIRFILISCFDL
jgi:hypothetical protein